MTQNKLLIPVAFLALLALAACSQEAQPTNAAPAAAEAAEATPPAASAEVTDSAPVAAAMIWADPLPTCEGKQITTVYWSKEALAAGPVRIEIGEGTEPGLFASVGAEGSKATGPWAAPGIVFVVRAASDGAERGRVVLAGPGVCP